MMTAVGLITILVGAYILKISNRVLDDAIALNEASLDKLEEAKRLYTVSKN